MVARPDVARLALDGPIGTGDRRPSPRAAGDRSISTRSRARRVEQRAHQRRPMSRWPTGCPGRSADGRRRPPRQASSTAAGPAASSRLPITSSGQVASNAAGSRDLSRSCWPSASSVTTASAPTSSACRNPARSAARAGGDRYDGGAGGLGPRRCRRWASSPPRPAASAGWRPRPGDPRPFLVAGDQRDDVGRASWRGDRSVMSLQGTSSVRSGGVEWARWRPGRIPNLRLPPQRRLLCPLSYGGRGLRSEGIRRR